MAERWGGKPLALLGSVAALEVAWRSVVEASSLLEPVVIPILGYIAAREVLNVPTVGMLLGWLLLGLAVFQTVPDVFPDRYLSWGNDVIGRVIVAVGAVGISPVFDGLFGLLPYLEGGSVNLIAGAQLLGVVAVIAAGYTVFLGQYLRIRNPDSGWRPLQSVIRYRDPAAAVRPGVPPVGVLVSRVLLVVALAGAVLAAVSRLYPLPEFLFIGLATAEGLWGAVAIRTDIAEGFVTGLRAVWAGPRGIIGVSYGIGALLFVIFADVAYITGMSNRTSVITDPVALPFVMATLGIGSVHVLAAGVTLIQRLPAAVGVGGGLPEARQRIPGLMLPAAALFIFYEFVRQVGSETGYVLAVTVSELVVAFGVAIVAIIPLVWPRAGPKLPISDYVAIVLSPALLFGVWAAAAVGFAGGSATQTLGGAYALTMVALSPVLGYELFHTGTNTEGRFAEMIDEAKLAGKATVVVLIVAAIYEYVLRALLPPVLPVQIGGLLIASLLSPCLFGLGIRLVLIPFYLPEKFGGQSG